MQNQHKNTSRHSNSEQSPDFFLLMQASHSLSHKITLQQKKTFGLYLYKPKVSQFNNYPGFLRDDE